MSDKTQLLRSAHSKPKYDEERVVKLDKKRMAVTSHSGNHEVIKKKRKNDVRDDVATIIKDLKENLNPLIYRNIIRQIFLNLDHVSLKRARQVCREWDDLVKREVWGSEEGRREMERRLDRQWREAEPTRREVTLVGCRSWGINASCDETHIAISGGDECGEFVSLYLSLIHI